MHYEPVGQGILKVNGFGTFKLTFTDGASHYQCRPYALNDSYDIMFHVFKVDKPSKELRDGLERTIEEIRKAHPFVFKLKGNKYVGRKDKTTYFAFKMFNNLVVMEKGRYFGALDISLNKKLKKISLLLSQLKIKLSQKT